MTGSPTASTSDPADATATVTIATPGTITTRDSNSSVASSAPATGTEATSPGPLAKIPTTPLGDRARWVLATLAANSGPDSASATEHFAPAFLRQVPASKVAAVFDQLRALGPSP